MINKFWKIFLVLIWIIKIQGFALASESKTKTLKTMEGVLPNIHKICLEAKDYAGCVQVQTKGIRRNDDDTFNGEIKELSCTNDGESAPTLSVIIDKKSGDVYKYDELSEKLLLLNGERKTEYGDGEISVRSAIVGNTWKGYIVTKFTNRARFDDRTEVSVQADLEKLRFSMTTIRISPSFPGANTAKGTCKWSRPKTTVILNTKQP